MGRIDTSNHKILIVDDEGSIRELLGEFIESFCPDAYIDFANSRREAEQKLEVNPYTHVLTDMSMEGPYSGVYVARSAKKVNPKIRVFLHTGSNDRTMENKIAREPSIDEYAFKPNSLMQAANFAYRELF